MIGTEKWILLLALLISNGYATDPQRQVRYGCGKFGYDFYENLCSESSQNVVFSPFSAYSALSMVYNGAGGTTKEAFSKALYVEDPVREAEGYKDVITHLNGAGDGVTVSSANKIYVKEGRNLKANFEQVCKTDFLSDVNKIDFTNNEKSAQVINDWVQEKTHDKIKGIIAPDDITTDTEIVLVNALYFKGQWLYPFNPDDTEGGDFYTSDKDKVVVPLMYNAGEFNYKEDTELGMKVVELPFKNQDFCMFIFLPNERQGLNDLQKRLATVEEESVRKGMERTFIDVTIPKFSFSRDMDMKENLEKLGLGEIFEPSKCDLTNMFEGGQQVHVSKAVQKTFIDVNEEGVEAASATSISGVGRSLPLASFKADHPFMFSIVHKNKDSISDYLLAGRVVNPTPEN